MATKGTGKMQVEKPKQATKTTGGTPENVLRRQQRDTKLAEQLKASRAALKKTRQDKKQEYLKRGQRYHEEYQKADKTVIDERRKAKASGAYFVQDEPKLYFAIRIRGINRLNPQVRKILQLLRLRQLHNGVFIRVNKATTNMLRKVEPYIAYGYPSRTLVKQLVYKRGFGKVNKQRVPLANNEIVEKSLGKQGLICLEDLIHEIVTVGPHFKEANNFLWPFKLNPPKKGFVAKRHPYHSQGDWGNREEEVNELIRRML
jgi:large subunit ribosomal protein L7e